MYVNIKVNLITNTLLLPKSYINTSTVEYPTTTTTYKLLPLKPPQHRNAALNLCHLAAHLIHAAQVTITPEAIPNCHQANHLIHDAQATTTSARGPTSLPPGCSPHPCRSSHHYISPAALHRCYLVGGCSPHPWYPRPRHSRLRWPPVQLQGCRWASVGTDRTNTWGSDVELVAYC